MFMYSDHAAKLYV